MSFLDSHNSLEIAIIPSNRYNTRYLWHYLRANYENLRDLGRGGNQPNLNLSIVGAFKVPLPPLEEQRRIAAILDRADAVRRKRQEAIALTEELLRSAFLEMFGDPIINPRNWNFMPISDVAVKTRYAIVDGPFGASLKQEEYVEEGIPVIRINNIKPLAFHSEEFKFITQQKFDELKRSAVRKNDILMARVGHTVGKACLFDQDYPALLSTTGVAKITCESSIICPEFLVHQLNLPQYQKYLAMQVEGAGQPYLNLTKIKALQVIVPPMPEQDRFVQLVNFQNEARRKLLDFQNTNVSFFNALLHKAFRGEL